MTTETGSSFAGEKHIDIRDVIARVEELREEREQSDIPANEYGGPKDTWAEARAELAELESLLDDLKGYGGDEQWEGEWYPVGLIHEDAFTDAMRELVQDIGDLPRDIPGYLAIDWEQTAENLRADYSSVEFGGATYWYR